MPSPNHPKTTINPLPKPANPSKEHHILDAQGKRTAFTNPWPSYRRQHSPGTILSLRFSRNRNFTPIPSDPSLLVQTQKPSWGVDEPESLKATWIGHASWLIEFPTPKGAERGLRVLLDPVWSDRMSPVSFLGPKRFRAPPCTLEECPEVDVVVISHDHYDHLDLATIKNLYFELGGKERGLRFLCGLGMKEWFSGIGVRENDVWEGDWWDGVDIALGGVEQGEAVRVMCTPSQHFSGRSIFNQGRTLWCSWAFEDLGSGKKLYFAGDTGYRTITEEDKNEGKNEDNLSVCPAFKEIGEKLGPFDLALLPIGCYTPKTFMSAVHCAPEDSVEVHKAVRSKKSIGMHYGVVRGGISEQYEDVLEPSRRWKESCEKAELKWGKEVGLCDLGETVFV